MAKLKSPDVATDFPGQGCQQYLTCARVGCELLRLTWNQYDHGGMGPNGETWYDDSWNQFATNNKAAAGQGCLYPAEVEDAVDVTTDALSNERRLIPRP